MKRWIVSLFGGSSLAARPSAPPAVDQLEHRRLFAASGPQVVSTIADNRGEVLIRFDEAVNPATINRRSVMMHLAGDDDVIGTADDEKIRARVGYDPGRRTVTVRPYAPIPANTSYRVKLNSKIVRDAADGTPLDGEYNASGASGNGEQRGDYVFLATRNFKANTARFTTDYGAFHVNLFRDQTPQTVANFYNYADAGDWDGTFFHRSVADFVLQGGGFTVNDENNIDDIPADAAVTNEPGIANNRGRISMAKVEGNANSATNQWFINLDDNTDLNTQNGGFTAFGEIANNASWEVVETIAGLQRVNAGGAFGELPVKDAAAVSARGALDPGEDVVNVTRVAMLMRTAPLA